MELGRNFVELGSRRSRVRLEINAESGEGYEGQESGEWKFGLEK